MEYNPFGTVRSYSEMLKKITSFTFFSTLLALLIVSILESTVADWLKPFSMTIQIAGAKVSLGIVVLAFGWAFFTRLIKLHDRISDLLGLRRRFDIEHILKPMAQLTAVQLSDKQMIVVKYKRRQLMNDVFYKYASSGPGKSVIDEHYITMALDQWTWFWVLVEGIVTWLLAAVFLFAFQRWIAGIVIVVLIGVAIVLLVAGWHSSIRYAKDEIEQILKDSKRKAAVAEVFRAI